MIRAGTWATTCLLACLAASALLTAVSTSEGQSRRSRRQTETHGPLVNTLIQTTREMTACRTIRELMTIRAGKSWNIRRDLSVHFYRTERCANLREGAWIMVRQQTKRSLNGSEYKLVGFRAASDDKSYWVWINAFGEEWRRFSHWRGVLSVPFLPDGSP